MNQIFSCRLDGPHAAEVSVRLDVPPLFLGGPVTRARRVEADRLRAHTTWRALRTLRGLIAVRHSGHKTCPFTIVLWTCVVTHRTQNFASWIELD